MSHDHDIAKLSAEQLEALAVVLPAIVAAGDNAGGAAVNLLAAVNSERRERVASSMAFGSGERRG